MGLVLLINLPRKLAKSLRFQILFQRHPESRTEHQLPYVFHGFPQLLYTVSQINSRLIHLHYLLLVFLNQPYVRYHVAQRY